MKPHCSGLMLVGILVVSLQIQSHAEELTGVYRKQQEKKGYTPILEIDGAPTGGITKRIELSGASLATIRDGTRIWVKGEIKTRLAGNPADPDATQSGPRWRIVFVVTKHKAISKAFETPRKE